MFNSVYWKKSVPSNGVNRVRIEPDDVEGGDINGDKRGGGVAKILTNGDNGGGGQNK